MGIPKFFRWLSERYPLINQVREREMPVTHVSHRILPVRHG